MHSRVACRMFHVACCGCIGTAGQWPYPAAVLCAAAQEPAEHLQRPDAAVPRDPAVRRPLGQPRRPVRLATQLLWRVSSSTARCAREYSREQGTPAVPSAQRCQSEHGGDVLYCVATCCTTLQSRRYAVQAFHSDHWWDDAFIELMATEVGRGPRTHKHARTHARARARTHARTHTCARTHTSPPDGLMDDSTVGCR